MNPYITRRDFIQFSASVAAFLGLSSCMNVANGPRKARVIAPGAKVRFAQIGCGGKGFSDCMAQKDEEVVAICDIDWEGVTPRNAGGRRAGKDGKDAKEAPPMSNIKKLFAEFPNA